MADPQLPPSAQPPAPPPPPTLWDLLPKPSLSDLPGAQSVSDAYGWARSHFPSLPEHPIDALLAHDKAVAARQAQTEAAARAKLLEQRNRILPGPIHRVLDRGVDAAKNYAASFFEPDPQTKATGDILKERAKAQLPMTGDARLDAISAPARALPQAVVDQFVDASSPGGALLNLDVPGGSALGPLSHAGAVYKPATIGGIAPRGELAKTLFQTGEHAHSLYPDVIERFGHAYDYGRGMDPKADWSGIQTPVMRRAFDQDRATARFWAELFGASSPTTEVPQNTRESVGLLAHALEKPGQPLGLDYLGGVDKHGEPVRQTMLYNNLLTAAGSKTPTINQLIAGYPNTSPKTSRMSRFMQGLMNGLPIDRHVLYGAGAESDKLAVAFPSLRKYLMETEGLTAKQLSGPKGEELMYGRLQDALIRGLSQLDPGRDFHPLFGDVWEGIRGGPRDLGLKGLKFQGGPTDFLRTYDLLDQGAMLDPDRLKRVYKKNPQFKATPR